MFVYVRAQHRAWPGTLVSNIHSSQSCLTKLVKEGKGLGKRFDPEPNGPPTFKLYRGSKRLRNLTLGYERVRYQWPCDNVPASRPKCFALAAEASSHFWQSAPLVSTVRAALAPPQPPGGLPGRTQDTCQTPVAPGRTQKRCRLLYSEPSSSLGPEWWIFASSSGLEQYRR